MLLYGNEKPWMACKQSSDLSAINLKNYRSGLLSVEMPGGVPRMKVGASSGVKTEADGVDSE